MYVLSIKVNIYKLYIDVNANIIIRKAPDIPAPSTDSGFARRTPKGVSSSCPAMGAHGRILGPPKSYHRVCAVSVGLKPLC